MNRNVVDAIGTLINLSEDFSHLMTLRAAVVDKLKSLGFAYVALDLQGFRTGSMNEVLSP